MYLVTFKIDGKVLTIKVFAEDLKDVEERVSKFLKNEHVPAGEVLSIRREFSHVN